MSSVAQAVRTTAVTRQQSLVATKNLVRCAVAQIAYIRNLFEDDCFEAVSINGSKARVDIRRGWRASTALLGRSARTGREALRPLHPLPCLQLMRLVPSRASGETSEEARQLQQWIEEGVFPALAEGVSGCEVRCLWRACRSTSQPLLAPLAST